MEFSLQTAESEQFGLAFRENIRDRTGSFKVQLPPLVQTTIVAHCFAEPKRIPRAIEILDAVEVTSE
ncbi:MAG: hypothetical protein CMJ46_09055 [Planctomyces sp.]|nr:hypothetical protein [Planctomyces sp.]